MGKSFEDSGQQKRKWMCFVCAKGYDAFDDYKKHIITEHEEGREYLKCPACEAPVRDLKSHFKVKHPNRVMPTNSQIKVTVWHDFSPSGKKKGTRKPRVQTGYFVSEKMRKEIRYRSRLEADFYGCLEADDDVMYFEAEPCKIPYFWMGEWHNYIPDIRVRFSDNTDQLWEIKPTSQTEFDQNKAKWASANNHCESVGWDFVVQTEAALKNYQSKVERQRARKLNN